MGECVRSILAHSLFVSVYFGRASTRPYSYAMSPRSYAMSPRSYAMSPRSYAMSPRGYAMSPRSYAMSPSQLRDNTLYRYLCKQFRGE